MSSRGNTKEYGKMGAAVFCLFVLNCRGARRKAIDDHPSIHDGPFKLSRANKWIIIMHTFSRIRDQQGIAYGSGNLLHELAKILVLHLVRSQDVRPAARI